MPLESFSKQPYIAETPNDKIKGEMRELDGKITNILNQVSNKGKEKIDLLRELAELPSEEGEDEIKEKIEKIEAEARVLLDEARTLRDKMGELMNNIQGEDVRKLIFETMNKVNNIVNNFIY
jgi:uncharacterized coiled-coil DUF342 family protein